MLDRIKYNYPDIPIIAFDILNEDKREDITECDFLKTKIEYKQGRICIMNPPFSKGLKFIYKVLESCDYCVCITSSNSFLNLNYDEYVLDEIIHIKKCRFEDDKYYNINLMAVRKKEWYD